MTLQLYTLSHYDISALPPERPMARHYTIYVHEVRDGKYVIQDGYGLHVTQEGRYDNSGILSRQSAYYKNHCLMDEDEVLDIAKVFLKKMTVGHMSATDVLRADEMRAAGATEQEIKDFSEPIRTNRELMDEYILTTFVTDEDVENEEKKEEATS